MVVALELPGNFKFKALGATKLEVNIKKINSKKIISVKDDILNSALTLLLFFNPIMVLFSLAKLGFNGFCGNYSLDLQLACYLHNVDHIIKRCIYFRNDGNGVIPEGTEVAHRDRVGAAAVLHEAVAGIDVTHLEGVEIALKSDYCGRLESIVD